MVETEQVANMSWMQRAVIDQFSSDLETVTACSYPNLPDALPSSYDTKKIPNASGKRTKPLTKARKNPEHCVNVSRRGWWL